MKNLIIRLQEADERTKRRAMIASVSVVCVAMFFIWLVQVRSIIEVPSGNSGGAEVVAGPARVGLTALIESGKYAGAFIGKLWNSGSEYQVVPER